jgi:hypothetical protein
MVRHHYTFARQLYRKATVLNAGKDGEKLDHSFIADGNIKGITIMASS